MSDLHILHQAPQPLSPAATSSCVRRRVLNPDTHRRTTKRAVAWQFDVPSSSHAKGASDTTDPRYAAHAAVAAPRCP